MTVILCYIVCNLSKPNYVDLLCTVVLSYGTFLAYLVKKAVIVKGPIFEK